VLVTFLCAAPLITAPAHASADTREGMAFRAHASADMRERIALREVLRRQARASAAKAIPLPLPPSPRAWAAASPAEFSRLARGAGPRRVLVGVRSHAGLAAVSAKLRSLGAEPEPFAAIGVVAATVPSGAALVDALRGDPRVAYIERDRRLTVAQDPFDAVDPATGLKYTWAFDRVDAGPALFAAGGGSRRSIAVIDTGLDLSHPEFAGRVAGTVDTASGGGDVTDVVGHGTFVTGLIAALAGNNIGGKGVAGDTKVLAVRASVDGEFTITDLIRGIQVAIERGADVLNMSLAGGDFSISHARALEVAFYNDVLPVAAAGNLALQGNPLEFPAAALGGSRGRRGIGLSVAATRPDDTVADFSNHNRYVSLAAPGAGIAGCEFGVFSTLSASTQTLWDEDPCSTIHTQGGLRFAYGEGTSFAAPIVSGIAALVWQVEPRLASEQVADVLIRSARRAGGRGWDEYVGWGILDGAAATRLAQAYDVSRPPVRGSARRHGLEVTVRLRAVGDRTEAGRQLAGRVTYGLLLSRDGGRSYTVVVRGRRRPFRRAVQLRGTGPHVLIGTACDANGNCGVKRLGRFKAG
jgi:subtilisin family serine protease